MKVWTALLLITLSSCTLNIQDKRLTREEVIGALQQRDQAIETLTRAVMELQKKSPQQKAAKK